MNATSNIQVDDLIERAKKIYAALNELHQFEKNNVGQYIAIDVESQKYFVSDTRDGAIQAGQAELPNVVFFVKKIGGMDTVARSYPYRRREILVHGRLL